MDLAADFAVPLPMMVIAEMLGIPTEDLPRYKRWSDEILKLSYSLFGGEDVVRSVDEYRAATAEMRAYLPELLAPRRSAPKDDLITRLLHAEVDGERLAE